MNSTTRRIDIQNSDGKITHHITVEPMTEDRSNVRTWLDDDDPWAVGPSDLTDSAIVPNDDVDQFIHDVADGRPYRELLGASEARPYNSPDGAWRNGAYVGT